MNREQESYPLGLSTNKFLTEDFPYRENCLLSTFPSPKSTTPIILLILPVPIPDKYFKYLFSRFFAVPQKVL